MSINILVCITHVPDTTSKIAFEDNNTRFDKNGVQYVIGPYDDFALARAVEIKEDQSANITVLNVGLEETEPTIRKALAIGADEAIRINAEPVDAFFVANQIAKYAKEEKFDLILMGRESSDYNSGLVHGMVGEMLGIPTFAPVMTLDIDGDTVKMSREIEGGHENIEAKMPLVAGCQEPIAEWRIPNMRGIMTARSKSLSVLEPEAIEPNALTESYELPPEKGEVKLVDPEEPEKLIELLRNEAKVI